MFQKSLSVTNITFLMSKTPQMAKIQYAVYNYKSQNKTSGILKDLKFQI